MPMPTRASSRSGFSSSAARNSRSAAPGRRCSNSRQAAARSSWGSGAVAGGTAAASSSRRWHFLYFLPDPQGQGSLRPAAPRRARAASRRFPSSSLLSPAASFAPDASVSDFAGALSVVVLVLAIAWSLLGQGPYRKTAARIMRRSLWALAVAVGISGGTCGGNWPLTARAAQRRACESPAHGRGGRACGACRHHAGDRGPRCAHPRQGFDGARDGRTRRAHARPGSRRRLHRRTVSRHAARGRRRRRHVLRKHRSPAAATGGAAHGAADRRARAGARP